MSNKFWVQEGEKYVLYFEPFYALKEKYAEVYQEDDGGWCFNSEELHTCGEYLGSDSLEDAKSDVEYLLQEYFEEQRDYYAAMLEKFVEE